MTAMDNENAKAKHEAKTGRRGKRKADVVRPGPLYRLIDTIVTIAGLALIAAVIFYVIMIFA